MEPGSFPGSASTPATVSGPVMSSSPGTREQWQWPSREDREAPVDREAPEDDPGQAAPTRSRTRTPDQSNAVPEQTRSSPGEMFPRTFTRGPESRGCKQARARTTQDPGHGPGPGGYQSSEVPDQTRTQSGPGHVPGPVPTRQDLPGPEQRRSGPYPEPGPVPVTFNGQAAAAIPVR